MNFTIAAKKLINLANPVSPGQEAQDSNCARRVSNALEGQPE
jgi:hypothetical protein